MRKAVLLACAVLIAGGCGVNPDRVAEMSERNARFTDRGMAMTGKKSEKATKGAKKDRALKYDDNDPAAIRQAIMDVEDLEKLVDDGRYAEYLTKRYALMKTVSYEAGEDVATSSKTPLIIDAVMELDKRVATVGGPRATEVVNTVGRVQMASADALYAMKDAFAACEQATAVDNADAMNDAKSRYEAALQRAESVDAKAMTFVGKKVTGGGYIDVPAEIAVCEARLATKKAMLADAPAKPEDRTREYSGCGYYAISVEAKQTANNKFGDYLITSSFVADEDPGAANPVECDTIPPVSDAEAAVQKVAKEFVAWLQPTDIISMEGKFAYEPGDDGKLTKKGVARIFRKSATLKTNACGAEPGTTCEADGSAMATAYNHATHYLGRAEYYKGQGNAARCRTMADMAAKAAGASSDEEQTLNFQVRGGQQFAHADMTTKLAELKTQAESAASSDWCEAPQP